MRLWMLLSNLEEILNLKGKWMALEMLLAAVASLIWVL
jgi:hypothetical protein